MMDIDESDLKSAASILSLKLTQQDLDYFLKKYLPPQALDISEEGRIIGTKYSKAMLIVEARQLDLLSDVELRKALIYGDPDCATRLYSGDSDRINLDKVAIRSWHPGKDSAKRFTAVLGFPHIFAGIPTEPSPDTLVDIFPTPILPPLIDFQEDVISQLMDVLEKRSGHEAMISLPTGAGKTRVAMEAIIRFQNINPDSVIIWLATTGEICEQASQTYLTLRHAYPPNEFIQLHRLWGSHDINHAFERGLIVASVQKIRSLIQFELFPYKFMSKISAIFFDEGHHAIAPTYEATLEYLEQGGMGGEIPIIGLSATPGRGSDPGSRASRRLVRRFGRQLLIPRGPGWDDPVSKLQQEGILSEIKIASVHTHLDFKMDKKMMEYWNEFKEFSPELLKKIGQDNKRNYIIAEQIQKQCKDRKGLIYCCSVEQANYLAFLLRRVGIPSASILGTTRETIRKLNLKKLKTGDIRFITNYGVLTTGFDEPSINSIVLARPIISQVLFEQMVGRGLRGPKFGGTKDCLILDFEDNIEFHGGPLAYQRFK